MEMVIVIGLLGRTNMIYKLKEKATKKQMKKCGYKHYMPDERFYHEQYLKSTSQYEIIIPLEECEYGKRVIQYSAHGSLPEELNPEDIEDLVELDLVEEVESDDTSI
jgi:hypothetical protein